MVPALCVTPTRPPSPFAPDWPPTVIRSALDLRGVALGALPASPPPPTLCANTPWLPSPDVVTSEPFVTVTASPLPPAPLAPPTATASWRLACGCWLRLTPMVKPKPEPPSPPPPPPPPIPPTVTLEVMLVFLPEMPDEKL